MIKANPRLPGTGLPSLYLRVYNLDLLSAVVCTYLGKPITYQGTLTPASSPKWERFRRLVYLISEAKYEFVSLKEYDLKALCILKSYYGRKLYIKEYNILL